MKKYLLATIAALALGSGSAVAADLIPEYKAAPVPIFNWSGFYIGADVGAAWGSNNWYDRFDGTLSTSYWTNGVLAGVHAGWNYQTGPIVLGVEGNLDFTSTRGSSSVVNLLTNLGGASTASLSTETNWVSTVVGRAGVTSGQVLYYLVGGWALQGSEHTASAFYPGLVGGGSLAQTISDTGSGYVLGFGGEFAVWQNFSAKLEYNYMDFGEKTLSFPGIDTSPVKLDQQIHVVKLGISYLFH
ncbi:MAG: outer membrane beta-barrel protein [Xanthobacteraceae bacterium]